MKISASDIVLEQLEIYGGRQKTANKIRLVLCPFHDEKTPSCGVVIDESHEYRVGSFHCFGCDQSGGWNKFAEKAGLKKLKKYNYETKSSSIDYYDDTDKELLPLKLSDMDTLSEILNTKDLYKWPKEQNWRGFKGNLLKSIGCYSMLSKNEEYMLVFPVKVAGKIRGAIQATMEKKKGQISYITSKGKWVKKYGLFLADKIERDTEYIILVEGPRDALSLYELGMPGIAILGSSSFSKIKSYYLLSLFPKLKTVYVMPDNDKAGEKMFNLVFKTLNTSIQCRRIRLPSREKVKKKLDPNNIGKDYLIKLRSKLKSIHK